MSHSIFNEFLSYLLQLLNDTVAIYLACHAFLSLRLIFLKFMPNANLNINVNKVRLTPFSFPELLSCPDEGPIFLFRVFCSFVTNRMPTNCTAISDLLFHFTSHLHVFIFGNWGCMNNWAINILQDNEHMLSIAWTACSLGADYMSKAGSICRDSSTSVKHIKNAQTSTIGLHGKISVRWRPSIGMPEWLAGLKTSPANKV